MTAAAPILKPGTDEPPHIFLVAGEASGDRLGAALMEAVRALTGGRVRFSGVGGSEMAVRGLATLFPIDDLAILGVASIPRRLPSILRKIGAAAQAVVSARPDALVIIDSPDFTHRVARRVRKLAPDIPIIDYVSPTVWVWRPGRARAMRPYIDRVLALLPFEPQVHTRLGGPPCAYVGHPAIERVGQLRPDPAEARRRLADPPILLVLPGSRQSELKRLGTTFGEAVRRVTSEVGSLNVVIPTVPELAADVGELVAHWPGSPRVVTDAAQKDAAFRTARAALAKSGTVTLELALAGVPMVGAYKLSSLEATILRFMVAISGTRLTTRSVILANLVLDSCVVPEFLQQACTADRLAAALIPLMRDSAERRRQVEAMARLDAIMEIGSVTPSERAARWVLEMAKSGRSGS